MPRIRTIGTAVPENVVTRNDAKNFAEAFFANHFKDIRRFMSVFVNADIETRYASVPSDWFSQPHTFEEKNRLSIHEAIKLSKRAVESCLLQAGTTVDDIDEIIFVSSTGISTPSLDAHLLNEIGLDSHLRRTPIWGLGCGGGAAGLARGLDFARARPDRRILVVSVELCTLTFQYDDKSKSNLIATALFGDGAAAVLIEGDGVKTGSGLELVDSRSMTWPNTLDVMGWELTNNGLDVIFSRDIPTLIRNKLYEETTSFLDTCGVSLDDISVFAAHPGGRKVIDAYQDVFECEPESLQFSRDILRNYGNMSSPTVLFVLKDVLQKHLAHSGDKVLAFALGPGFSCEQVLLEWN